MMRTRMKTKTSNSKLLAFLSFFILCSSPLAAHKFYMSITDMEYKPETKSLQVIVKFFVDDLELALEKQNNTSIRLNDSSKVETHKALLKDYLSRHFVVEQDKGSINFTYVGQESDKDYTWVYFEYKNFNPDEESLLTNTLLIEQFPDQTNKVNYKNGQVASSFTLHKSKVAEEF